ncbi:hypothetical protein [Haloarchaeobius iranensis]|uniref:Uncharacterized protein n=1 Tax=Haloarchaeobius iranensis TaxID=996166 RepID=A0A1H0A8P6_9EURY|nr:hypothetical protein [Haloarchaeobius iranensis]SDN30008.1 hypothetical protein SAMN05192554_12545 [Haloarchaeobius iranensis]
MEKTDANMIQVRVLIRNDGESIGESTAMAKVETSGSLVGQEETDFSVAPISQTVPVFTFDPATDGPVSLSDYTASGKISGGGWVTASESSPGE